MGNIWIQAESIEEAMSFFYNAFKFGKEIKDFCYSKSLSFCGLGIGFYKLKKYNLAINCFY